MLCEMIKSTPIQYLSAGFQAIVFRQDQPQLVRACVYKVLASFDTVGKLPLDSTFYLILEVALMLSCMSGKLACKNAILFANIHCRGEP